MNILGNGFQPGDITIDRGTTVTWINGDGNAYVNYVHSVESDTFFSSDMGYGDTFSYTYNLPGTFYYWDSANRSIIGTVRVNAVVYPQGTGTVPETLPSQRVYPSSSQEAYSVYIKNYSFNPADLVVPLGSTVTWINNDGNAWSGTFYGIESDEGTFTSDPFGPGDIFGYTFPEPGTYTYQEINHPSMTGVIRVVDVLPSQTTATTTTPFVTTTNPPTSTTMPVASFSVILMDENISPSDIQIPIGATVTWVNNGLNTHRVVTSGDLHAGTESQEPQTDLNLEKEFASPDLQNGDIYSYTFVAAGVYYYYDYYNPSMKGQVIVTSGA